MSTFISLKISSKSSKFDLANDQSKLKFKGSPDPNHFIYEISVGKRRIRHRTTLNLNFFLIDSKLIEDDIIQIESRSLSDPPLSDIDFKNKMAWVLTTLKGVILDFVQIG